MAINGGSWKVKKTDPMKRLVFLSLFFLTVAIAHGQGNPGDWKQAREFHFVLASVLAAAEEGNTEPLRSRASELDLKARQLTEKGFPAAYDNKTILNTVIQIQQETDDLMKKSANSQTTDTQLLEKLRKIRKLFRDIHSVQP